MPNQSALLNGLATIQKAIQSRISITEEELTALLQKASFRQFGKGEILISEGEVEEYVSFILDGVTRSFFFKDDKDISFEFMFAGSFISSYVSFLQRTPSGHSIEAFTPLVVVRFRHQDLSELLSQTPKAQQISRVFTEELFKKTSERVKDLISLSATERYQKLLDAYPQYVREIPLKYLASYLNVTPESLSRIRKNLS